MKNLTFKAVENSKNTSCENGNNPAGGSGQLTVAQKQQQVALAVEMGCTHFQTHLPMDTDAQMQANYSGYSSHFTRTTLEVESQEWADAIHAAGLKHVMRGTWLGIKNNLGFPYVTYGTGTFVPLGTVNGASSEGETTYCGKMYRFLNTNIGAAHLATGDIISPISECTEFLSNASEIWFDTTGGTQAALYTFFATLKAVVDAYGTSIGKTLSFMTIVNYSEYRSGYLNSTLPAAQGVIPIDYYGHSGSTQGDSVEPANRVADWIAVRSQVGGAGYPLYQTELGLIFALQGVDNNADMPRITGVSNATGRVITTYEDAALYLMQLFKAYRDSLIDPGLMNGVSQWGFWSGQNSSILYFSGGTYKPNYIGQIYSNFLKGNGMARIPVLQSGGFSDDTYGGRSAHF